MLPHAQVQGLQCLPGVCTLHRSVASRSLLRFFAHAENISKSTAARFLTFREHKSYRGLEERTTRSKSAGAKHSTTSDLGRGVYLCVPVRARAGVHERERSCACEEGQTSCHDHAHLGPAVQSLPLSFSSSSSSSAADARPLLLSDSGTKAITKVVPDDGVK